MTQLSLEVVAVPVLDDNYVWMMHDRYSNTTVVIDPGVAEPVMEAADSLGWSIDQIWITHWHDDHVGGNAVIKAATDALLIVPSVEAHRITLGDQLVYEGSSVAIGRYEAQVLNVPGHTSGHIAYFLPEADMVFVGDTLFPMGCGRLFEGSASHMWNSLRKLASLPPCTLVYSAHEYAQTNLRFALSVDPDNRALQRRSTWVADRRNSGRPTLPTTIGAELATNPFMRARSPEEFGSLRRLKDAFR
ncbi:hydroxyacylglutathione hydrolase [Paraburkholderia caballeronis]|uniref:Hydroxyacylglutathione hydrolase n=1 Tax=Paraburkholderia caballeronis TaxID=416943 RepID=A0A1H7L6Z7_9BURK|nr:hydroxyacylglutathione hydrolase [Paraburkholderia caballeronis]PXW28324.1 hydroxyacylglutathione hydrolase [Paraburkholderia caballeronis]PXX03690.1 hydroxyacylglutathione hydrolase [Paraburkholderia caballeronis]RAK04434.1 hydroxyacylglutathione hydrolase [Paraburkholderia caballeronis]SED80315.1 hydroxyacylglutathione hydrolase [Paraburkholderia caballeronis]SEK94833.1 hydroxyacylglutathione hydrolase [Paraburkholderia caballeronis]